MSNEIEILTGDQIVKELETDVSVGLDEFVLRQTYDKLEKENKELKTINYCLNMSLVSAKEENSKLKKELKCYKETIEVVSDKKLVKQLLNSLEDIKKGKFKSLKGLENENK